MKHVKMLGLLVMAAAALMAFTSSASAAPVLTSSAGTEYTGTINGTLESGTSMLLKAGIEDTCTTSTVTMTVSTNTTTHAKGAISTLDSGSCTLDTKTVAVGELTINDFGEVFAIGSDVEIKDTIFGITCHYSGGTSPGTKIGTLKTGKPAKLFVNTTQLKRIPPSNEAFCTATGTWEALYVVTTPAELFVT